PETAQAAMSALYRRWLQAAGVNVADDAVVEINPRFALDAEELAAKLPPGWRMDGSVYLE
ncbi:MAG: UDP-N-acetylglucosamine pyrophosphorylase, partial [Planctomycetota bacterium]